MPVTNKDGRLEEWANQAVAMEQNFEALYGAPATPPTLPPITNYDGMLEAIVDAASEMKTRLTDLSPIYHNKDSAYVKTVPSSVMPYASIQSIGGKTVVWNQLANFGTITASNTYGFTAGVQLISGHKYCFSCDANLAYTYDSLFIYSRQSGSNVQVASLSKNNNAKIFTSSINATATGSASATEGNVWLYVSTAITTGESFENIMLIDLTLLFGSGNEPTTVAEFESMFPASYYAYDNGTLLSADVQEVKSVGKNLFDKNAITDNAYLNTSTGLIDSASNYCVTDYIPVYTGQTVYIPVTYSGRRWFYDANKNPKTYLNNSTEQYYTPTENGYIRVSISTSLVDIDTVIIAYSTTRPAYVPYMSDTYSIPSSITSLSGYGWSAGSVCNEIDFERKVFVQRVDRIDLGSINWNKDTNRAGVFYGGSQIATALNKGEIICQKYVTIYTGVTTNQDMYIGFQASYGGKIPYIRDTNHTNDTGADFKTSLNGVYAYYQLETPIETDISSYLDDNTIEVEAGGTLTFENSHGDDYRIDVPSDILYEVNAS